MILDASRGGKVLKALGTVQREGKRCAALCIFGCPPPLFKPCAMVIGLYLGSTADAEATFKPILELKPDMYQGADVPYEKTNDSIDVYCVTGDYKAWAGAGLYDIVPEDGLFMLEKYKDPKSVFSKEILS